MSDSVIEPNRQSQRHSHHPLDVLIFSPLSFLLSRWVFGGDRRTVMTLILHSSPALLPLLLLQQAELARAISECGKGILKLVFQKPELPI